MDWKFERVAGPYEAGESSSRTWSVTEGPAWDAENNLLLFCDIHNSRIRQYDPETGETTIRYENSGGASGLNIGVDGRLYACEGDARRVTRYEPDGTRTVIADEYDGKRLNSPNDLAVDEQGRVWFTDPDYKEREDLPLGHYSVYCASPTGDSEYELTRITYDSTNPNGILLSDDESRLYVAEMEYGSTQELRAYELTDGSADGYTVLHQFFPHRGIDGMCFDSDGNIVGAAGWEKNGPGPHACVISPEEGVLERHPAPPAKTTNCAFGDDDLQTLYLTGADGCLYRARTDRQGELERGITD